ncbi:MAG: PH domain-containing protein [Gammaproteobacteria bacterium]|jgi:membrane protein YdbS with pleckstrin-like domain|nr:PH domain-containing protein [Gammaproteobacteria bacterium]
MFRNPEIALDGLPDMEDLDWQQMHPRYARRMQMERLIFVAVAMAVSFVPAIASGGEFAPTVPLWVLVIVVAIPFLGWPLISVPRRGYVIRSKDIVFKSGVFWRSVTAVPFNRVQHVETNNTPLDRKFGLANLQIFTAGGSGGDLSISGLGADVAERLRIYILDKVGASIENH